MTTITFPNSTYFERCLRLYINKSTFKKLDIERIIPKLVTNFHEKKLTKERIVTKLQQILLPYFTQGKSQLLHNAEFIAINDALLSCTTKSENIVKQIEQIANETLPEGMGIIVTKNSVKKHQFRTL